MPEETDPLPGWEEQQMLVEDWRKRLSAATMRNVQPDPVPAATLEFEFPKKELPQWEYRLLPTSTGEAFMMTLNAMGKNGWQVCERLGESLLLIREILPETPPTPM